MIYNGSLVLVVCSQLLGANAFSTQFSRRESLQAIVGGVTTAVIPSILPAFADDGPPVFTGTLSGSTPTEAAPVAKEEAAPVAKEEAAPVLVAKEEAAPAAVGEEGEAAPPPPPPVVEEKPKYISQVSEETPRVVTRMGGNLEAFQDGMRGVRIMAPSGWNKFEGEVGAYDIKWQDLVDNTENIKISSTPVKSTTTSIAVLGDPQIVGVGLAKKRNAKLISASERLTEGVLFYKFDFAIKDGTHQLLQLCVCKGKLWSLDANAPEKRWAKRSDMYEFVLGSFMPKLA